VLAQPEHPGPLRWPPPATRSGLSTCDQCTAVAVMICHLQVVAQASQTQQGTERLGPGAVTLPHASQQHCKNEMPMPLQVERVRQGGELPPWYDLSEWDDSGDTPAAETQSVSLQVPFC